MNVNARTEQISGAGTGISFKRLWLDHYLGMLLAVLLIVGSLVAPKVFLTKYNILMTLASNVSIMILAIGMFFVIVTGGIDLSVGSGVALAGCLLAGFLEAGMSWYTAVLAVLGIMIIPGLISGISIAYGGIQPFIATLAMMTILRGLAYMYQTGSPKMIFDDNLIFLGDGSLLNDWVPVPLLIALIITAICALILKFTPYGRTLYAIGDNAEAAHLSGMRVKPYTVSVYVISSFLAGVAGIIAASRLMLGSAMVGQGYESDAIAAVVIGGASLSGGSGSILGTVVGATIFAMISNILNLMGVGGYPQMIIKGGIIIAALIAVGRRAK